MKLVVGLGNVGSEYEKTRHNAGFVVVDELANRHDANWQHQTKFFAHTTTALIGADKVILAKPDTYMNRSGKAVMALMQYYKVPLEEVTIVSDDLDLTFGKVRVRIGGSSGGQNGLGSIIETVGKDFVRLRIGISGTERGQIDARDYVLQKFSAYEQKHLPAIATEAADILTEIITDGAEHLSRSILEN